MMFRTVQKVTASGYKVIARQQRTPLTKCSGVFSSHFPDSETGVKMRNDFPKIALLLNEETVSKINLVGSRICIFNTPGRIEKYVGATALG